MAKIKGCTYEILLEALLIMLLSQALFSPLDSTSCFEESGE